MTETTPPRPGESIPDVFDRIADTARRINDEGPTLDEQQLLGAPPVTVEKRSGDGAIRVVVADGHLTELEVDSQMRAEEPWPAIAAAVIALVNEALDEHAQLQSDRIGEVNKSFGALVGQLGILQADLRDAFTRDMGRLD
ncbi:MAG: YbaB/EbfC family nucleoid-associated protein [Arachnia sp.]